jgi:hypothetical protein
MVFSQCELSNGVLFVAIGLQTWIVERNIWEEKVEKVRNITSTPALIVTGFLSDVETPYNDFNNNFLVKSD